MIIKMLNGKNIAVIAMHLIFMSCFINYVRGRDFPPVPGAPEKYEAQLEAAEMVDDVIKFLIDIGDLGSGERSSAKLLAFEKLSRIADKDAAVELLSGMYHDEDYIHSASLSRHVKNGLIRTFGEIGTPKAKDELVHILNQSLQLHKISRSRHTSQLGIINAAMETLAEEWYDDPEIRKFLRNIAGGFREHSQTVRSNARKYHLISEMRSQGIIEIGEQVKWLLDTIDYDAYQRQESEYEGQIFISYSGDQQTWPGLTNEAVRRVLIDLLPESVNYLEELTNDSLSEKKENIIKYLIRRTTRLRAGFASNYLRDITRGTDILTLGRTLTLAGRINVPEDKILDEEYIDKAVCMLEARDLRRLISFLQDEKLPPFRRELQEFILERAERRLEEIEQ